MKPKRLTMLYPNYLAVASTSKFICHCETRNCLQFTINNTTVVIIIMFAFKREILATTRQILN